MKISSAGNSAGPPEKGVVAGIDIGGSNLRIALADLGGNVLERWNASTKGTSSPGDVVTLIERGVEQLLQQTCCSKRSLLSVAAGAPGVTDSRAGVVLATSFLRGWKDVPLGQLLESALGVPAAVENDVRMAALGEHWKGAARGVDDFVFLAIGTGIAAGVFANGSLIRGSGWTAGEVGYMFLPHTTEEPAKPGMPGAMESVIGGDGIRRQWLDLSDHQPSAQNLTATEIFSRASSGDPLAKRVLDRSAQILAYAAYNISLVLNSALFVLGGGIGVSVLLCEATKRILEKYNEPSRPNLVISSLGADAQLIGAIRLALAATTSPSGV
ncbi:MAG TPA: ROK family protein [Candidatus Acidoferrales bacterium]|nr:ROK family protein [Candidatus Acidoferrales bacterium]